MIRAEKKGHDKFATQILGTAETVICETAVLLSAVYSKLISDVGEEEAANILVTIGEIAVEIADEKKARLSDV